MLLVACLRISPDLGDELDELAADTEPVESGQGNHRKTTKTKGKKKTKTTAKKTEKKLDSAPSDVEKPVAKAKAKASNVVGAKKPFLSVRETMDHKRKRIQGELEELIAMGECETECEEQARQCAINTKKVFWMQFSQMSAS